MEMQTVLALVVVFTGTAHGVETTCNATQNVSCYGTLGQPLYLQLMTNTTEYDMFLFRNTSDGEQGILRVKAEIHMTPPISNTKNPPLPNDTRLASNGHWKIPNIMVVSGSSAAFFLCLTVSGGIFYICKRRKSPYKPEELEYADVSILKVEYGEVNLQKCPTPEVYLGGVFSLIVYAEIQSGNQRGQSVMHSI